MECVFSHHFQHAWFITPQTDVMSNISGIAISFLDYVREKSRLGRWTGAARKGWESALRGIRSCGHREDLPLTVPFECSFWHLSLLLSPASPTVNPLCVSLPNEWLPSLQHLSELFLCKASFPSFLAKKFLVFTPRTKYNLYCFQYSLQWWRSFLQHSLYITSSFFSLPVLKHLFKKITPSVDTFPSFLLVYLFSSFLILSRQNSFTYTHTSVPEILFPFRVANARNPLHVPLPIGGPLLSHMLFG